MAKFEIDWNSLKDKDDDLVAYLQNIPTQTIESLFKKSEIPTEVFSGILKTLSSHNFESKTDKDWLGKFLLSLSKANNFEMTLMFVGEKEKKNIEEIVSKIKKFD